MNNLSKLKIKLFFTESMRNFFALMQMTLLNCFGVRCMPLEERIITLSASCGDLETAMRWEEEVKALPANEKVKDHFKKTFGSIRRTRQEQAKLETYCATRDLIAIAKRTDQQTFGLLDEIKEVKEEMQGMKEEMREMKAEMKEEMREMKAGMTTLSSSVISLTSAVGSLTSSVGDILKHLNIAQTNVTKTQIANTMLIEAHAIAVKDNMRYAQADSARRQLGLDEYTGDFIPDAVGMTGPTNANYSVLLLKKLTEDVRERTENIRDLMSSARENRSRPESRFNVSLNLENITMLEKYRQDHMDQREGVTQTWQDNKLTEKEYREMMSVLNEEQALIHKAHEYFSCRSMLRGSVSGSNSLESGYSRY